MTAHKHAEIIKAKADNMDLVVFVKRFPHWEMDDRFPPSAQDIKERWFLATDFQWEEDAEYFLCLPQHKEACLHWLNGGEVECKSNIVGEEWTECYPLGSWHSGLGLMREDAKYRIKPRKEKRWIAVNSSGYATPMTFISKQECENYVAVSYQKFPGVTWQHIEIEVEV